MKKIGFLFGAGAEISYGMPTGGKFALDIFRHSNVNAKNKLRDMIKKVNKSSDYATYGLPDGFSNKNINAFTKRIYSGIIKDTIRNNRAKIIHMINNFDELAEAAAKECFNDMNDDSAIETIDKETKKEIGENVNVKQLLKYNSLFDEGDKLFESEYFSKFLRYYQKSDEFLNEDEKVLLGKLISTIFQLQIGALSSDVSSRVEDSVFEKDDLNLDLFDDLGGALNVNYENAGSEGLTILSEVHLKDEMHSIVKLAYHIVENIYASVLDYKSLIDENWHYLYSPQHDWAKFTKIIVFLYTVQEYILEQSTKLDITRPGYYTDLKKEMDKGKISPVIIGTTNYSSFIQKILFSNQSSSNTDIKFLNGGVEIYYDPYMNTMLKENENLENHIIVPLMFTQSGTKPMTSIDMLVNYSDFYQKMKLADAICSIGFGFNPDDEHINGIIRTLVERDDKTLVIVSVEDENERILKKKYARRLRISNIENIKIIKVNANNRKCEKNNDLWCKALEQL